MLAMSPIVILAIAAMLTVYASQRGPSTPRELLREIARITDAEWAAIERGEAVAKIIDTDNREVAVAGAVRIAAAKDRLTERYRDVAHLKRSTIVLDVGRFSRTPSAADLARAPFEEYNLDLRECRPFDCRVRLSERDIARFHDDVNWRDTSWRDRSAAVWRDVLAGYAASYARVGRQALPVFANKREPVSVASELGGLVQQVAFVGSYAPDMFAFMREFAPPIPNHAEDVLYWSKEDFGIRPVFRISHQVVQTSATNPATVAIATTQVYADHYLDAALTVTLALDAGGASPSFYLVSVNRARTRSLTGMLRSFVRSTVQSRSRDALRKILVATKTSLEK